MIQYPNIFLLRGQAAINCTPISVHYSLVIGSYAKLNKVSTSHGYKLVIDSHTHAQDEVAAKDALAKQIGNLQSQLESQTQEAKQKITELCKEREKLASEYEYIRQKDADKVKTVTEKLVFKSHDVIKSCFPLCYFAHTCSLNVLDFLTKILKFT